MNKSIIFVMVLFLLASVSSLYAGESTTFDLGQDYEYYSIVGNSSEVILDIQQNGTWIIITPDKYSIDDTYEIIFFDELKETIYISSGGGGGGGSHTIYKNITEYKYVDKIIETEVEKKIETEKIIEVEGEDNSTTLKIIVGLLCLLLILSFIWNIIKSNYTVEKEEKLQDE